MIVLLDTATPVCRLTLVDDEQKFHYEWQANRELAKGLLGWLRDRLAEHDKTFADITGIGMLRGPGSFTGLRIGLTVLNTLADGLRVPIVGTMDDTWRAEAVSRLRAGEDDQIVLPHYSTDANITTQRK